MPPSCSSSCGSIVGELPEARQAKGPTWAKPGMRQDTPNLDDGILTNGNVLLEERLDLLDFLDDVHAEARAAERAETQRAEMQRSNPAWMVARQATVDGAVRVLHDEVAPAAPWQLRTLFCVMFPCFGVVDTMCKLRDLLSPALRARLDEQLAILASWEPPSSSAGPAREGGAPPANRAPSANTAPLANTAANG
eukprot:CAMPEP_0118840806 /NCGR_PEP_ID=MMETSP1162-20130426/74129_1 /TAXON_ID=33656 /ORGANISM="Phaeocystis Sp, Strain CCMP2710" /LENGTH=193 /DNA_ID=CAMNT_0006772831 /DNA_START=12 /DNA_END=593 /DNA_ORIENTATION=-